MGAGQSDLYKGTYGDNPDNIADALKGKVRFPKDDSQIKHFMRADDGHLSDTPENRQLLLDLANDTQYYRGKDVWGNDWHVRLNTDGTQDWVEHRGFVIQEGGKNLIPKSWDDMTGLNYNPMRD